MTPSAIIKKAAAEGVVLTPTPAGTIKATGSGDAVNRWLPLIREHKPGILAALQEPANDSLPNPAAEARRQRVLAMLDKYPDTRYAVVVDDPDTDPVLLTLAIRGQGTCALAIPAAKFDPFELLAMLDRHGAKVH